MGFVPRYEFRCRECSEAFVVTRPMAQSSDPATCPRGHADTIKLLSVIGLGGRGGSDPVPAPSMPMGGGCCGGGCGCG